MPIETLGYPPPISPDQRPLRPEEGATKIVLPKTFVGHQVSLIHGEEEKTSTAGLKLSQAEQTPETREINFKAVIAVLNELLNKIIQLAILLKIIQPSTEPREEVVVPKTPTQEPESTPLLRESTEIPKTLDRVTSSESDEGKTVIQELTHLKDIGKAEDTLKNTKGRSIQVLHQFQRELVGSEYYLNGELLLNKDKRAQMEPQFHACKKLIHLFGEHGFKNISRVLNQALTPSMLIHLASEYPTLGFPVATTEARYGIEQVGKFVRLSIDFELGFREPEKEPSNYVGCHREILIPTSELKTNWDGMTDQATMPQTKVYDYYTVPQKTHEEAKKALSSLLHESAS